VPNDVIQRKECQIVIYPHEHDCKELLGRTNLELCKINPEMCTRVGLVVVSITAQHT